MRRTLLMLWQRTRYQSEFTFHAATRSHVSVDSAMDKASILALEVARRTTTH